jgi:uncharacterized protein YkwD
VFFIDTLSRVKMQLNRRAVGTFITAALLVVGLAPGAFAASEDSLLARINEERGAQGLGALVSHWDLVDDAEAHSQVMMATENLHHNPNLGNVTTGWVSLGENVGVGPTVSSIHTAFMASPPHRGNVLGDFTHVGIGAVRASENRMWVTVVFMKASGSATTTTSTTPTAPPQTTSSTTVAAPPSTSAPVPTSIAVRPKTAVAADAPAAEPPVALVTVVRVRLRHSPRPM